MTLVFQTYPHPGFQDRLIAKPNGVGCNYLGTRQPYSVTLHRMLGTLWGTDSYFRDPTVPALTDYGLGCAAMDGNADAGTILRWCDPRGEITPWASGPVSAPYGDGLCLVTFFGYYDCANKNAVSIEISGNQTTPIDDYSYGELVHLVAYWLDQMQVPCDGDYPLNPVTGCSSIVWHEEYTYGTGKRCPFDVVKALTDDLIADVQFALRPYQTGGEPVPAPDPEEEDPLGNVDTSGYKLDPKTVWPNYNPGSAVSDCWAAYGAATGVWNAPGTPWNAEGGQGCLLFQFAGGPLISKTKSSGKAGIVVVKK